MGEVVVDFVDSRGKRFKSLSIGNPQNLSLMRESIQQADFHWSPYGYQRIAAFQYPPFDLQSAQWPNIGAFPSFAGSEEIVAALDPDGSHLQPVVLLPGKWRAWPRFKLPLHVVTVGAATSWVDDAVRSRDWIGEIMGDDAALTTEALSDDTVRARRGSGRDTDIVFCSVTDLPDFSMALRNADLNPRLLVALSRGSISPDQVQLANVRLPAGTSLLLTAAGGQYGSESEAVVELFREFAHDTPLHLLGRRLDRYDTQLLRPAILFSQPKALDALRLSDALTSITDDVLDISFTATRNAVDKLPTTLSTTRLRKALKLERQRSLRLQSTDERGYSDLIGDGAGLEFLDQSVRGIQEFTREADGLVPMARIRKALAEEQEVERELQSAVEDVIADPVAREAYLGQQGRTIDVAIRSLGTDGAAGPFLKPYEPLVEAQPYRLRVQIGRRSSVSLVSGDVPPIDLLLPPIEKGGRHLLHVALYTDDFRLDSPILQRLELPEVGPSPPVAFDVVPLDSVRRAQARIAVYYDLPPVSETPEYRNHLIQTFVLAADVRQQDEPKGGSLNVRLEFSLNGRFRELEQLKPRLLAFALNDSASPGSHKLMMKRGDQAMAVNFTEALIADSLERIRDTFDWASRNDARNGPRFPADQQEGDRADFDAVLWKVAQQGAAIFRKLFDNNLGPAAQKLQEALGSARSTSDAIIQAVNISPDYAFPWTAIYDFSLPRRISGQLTPQVCDGFRRKKPDGSPFTCAQCLAACQHPDKREALCVYGFWGNRHQVEQLLAADLDEPRALRPVREGAVAYAMGLEGRYVDQIPNDLTVALGDRARKIADVEAFMPELWSEQRPAVLLLVGHYRSGEIDAEPIGPRLTLANDRFLTPEDVFELRIEWGDFRTDPRTVVLLAACSGAVVEMTLETNFVSQFTAAGAGAVIGPEAVIYEGLARRFAVDISAALVSGESVGAAVLSFRRNLLQNLNPLGLIITAYGFADLAAAEQPAVAQPN